MEELLRTTDPTLVPFASALLRGESIECFVLDANMSIMEGSIGVLPRRLMVRPQDLERARAVLRENGIDPYEREDWI